MHCNMIIVDDDDDDFLTASKGFSYFCIYWHIYASTFNPIGSLSSTEDNLHKNKQSKLQKVKVRKTN